MSFPFPPHSLFRVATFSEQKMCVVFFFFFLFFFSFLHCAKVFSMMLDEQTSGSGMGWFSLFFSPSLVAEPCALEWRKPCMPV